MSLVTIRGQLGSGAPEIGRKVADKLHFDYVDREIIAEVAARLQREERDVLGPFRTHGLLLLARFAPLRRAQQLDRAQRDHQPAGHA